MSPTPAGRFRTVHPALLTAVIVLLGAAAPAPRAAAMTVDEMFRFVEVTDARISPDGRSLACVTRMRDFANDCIASYLWRVGLDGGLTVPVQLTRSGLDDHPRWAADSRTLVFLRDTADDGMQL